MTWTNLKVFLRNLAGQGLFTAINVVGLSIGLASCLLIALYVRDELTHDTQHPDADNIYRISAFLVGVEQGGRVPIPTAAPLVGALLQQNFAEVEAYTRMAAEPVYLSVSGTRDYEDAVRFADPNFFTFFQFEWLQGTAATALAEPDSIVLTETLAAKYFGAEDPLGRVLLLQQDRPLKVTGLIRDLQRTHLSADAFVAMATLEALIGPQEMESWFSARFHNYVRLRDATAFAALSDEVHAFLDSRMPAAAQALYDPDSRAIREIHLAAPQTLGLASTSRRQDVTALLLVCIALLVIACINFINLATARSVQRGKEIGLRKVLGARRGQIFTQHMSESGLLVLLSLLLSLGIAELSLPPLNAFSGKTLSMAGTPALLAGLASLALTVVMLAGAYPALYLSAFRPSAVLKPASVSQGSGSGFRNVLVVLQFAIAIVLIVATTVIYQQVQYGKNIELGFSKDQVLVIENAAGESWSAFKDRMLATTAASHVSSAMNPPFKPIVTSISARYAGGAPEGENLAFFMVDYDYFELFGVDVIAGRTFAPGFASDRPVQPTAQNAHPGAAVVINRAMLEKLGWTAEDALGKRLELNWSPDYSLSLMGNVIGIVENMQVDSLRREVVPLLYMLPTSAARLGYTFVKLPSVDVPTALQQVDAIWNAMFQDQPVNRYFLDTPFQALYADEEKQASLLGVFAALAITISCLGLLGLAAFTAETRHKEIGVRKVLGGSVWSIVLLLTTDFSRLVLLANVIAWPVAWFVMNRWLENFAYRIDLTPMLFIGSGLIALCVAWATVGGTAAKAASQKPVLALRYE